ncbi:MAG: restriction endonuclease subunit S [Leptotrichiaceae bacterium]|nr:restriction endonuclease subunit S [Leptotrichiaceae bacterium]
MNRVPKIRFKEFSGEWEEKKIGEIMECIVPGRNKPQEFNGTIPWITTPDILNKNFVFHSKNRLNLSEIEIKKVGAKIIPKDSVIMSCVGELGVVCIAGTDVVINQQLHAFIPNKNIDNVFIKNTLLTKISYMETVATKTAVLYMKKETCNSIPVFLPFLAEQKKIADFLSNVDIKIEKLERKKELWEEYKKGMMQKIFSQEIRFKDENGNEYPQWEEKRLVEILEDYYQGINTTADNVKYYDEGYPILQAKHITNEYLDFNDVKYLNKEKYEYYCKKYKPRKNDILISNIGTLGKIVLIKEDVKFLIAWNIFKITLKVGVDSLYVFFLLKKISQDGYFEKNKTGNATKFVNKDRMIGIPVILPSLPEQEKIANLLSSIDSKIEIMEKELEGIKEFKKGLLQAMFV